MVEIYDWFEKQLNGRLSEKSLLDRLERFFLLYQEEEDTRTAREKAKEIVKLLTTRRYLEEEYIDQRRYYLLSVNAQKIIRLIKEMDVAEEIDYSSNLLTLYMMFSSGSRFFENPYTVVLKQAQQLTKNIEDQLRILQSGIRNRIVDTTKEMTLQELYDVLAKNHSEKGPFAKFLRLNREFTTKRMDTFMSGKIRELQASETFLAAAIQECMETDLLSEEDAKKEVMQILKYLKTEYAEEMPRRISLIYHTITEYYSRAAIKAEIASSSAHNTVTEQLKYIYSHIDEVTSEKINILYFNDIQHYDPFRYSLRKAVTRERRTSQNPNHDQEEILKLLKKEEERQEKNYFETLNKKIHQLLIDKEEITSDDLPIQSDEDMLFLHQALMYASHEDRCYNIRFEKERTKTEYGEYNKFRITRRLT